MTFLFILTEADRGIVKLWLTAVFFVCETITVLYSVCSIFARIISQNKACVTEYSNINIKSCILCLHIYNLHISSFLINWNLNLQQNPVLHYLSLCISHAGRCSNMLCYDFSNTLSEREGFPKKWKKLKKCLA